MIHIVPVNDLRDHDIDSTMCACQPRIEWSNPETGESYAEALVIHSAWDGRELVEQAEALLGNGAL